MSDARPRALGAALTAGALALALSSLTTAAVADTEIESELLALLNAEREAAGLPALAVDAVLAEGAQAWSAQLASIGSLSHDTFEVAEATAWGENVGRTSAEDAAARLHQLLMDSPEHRANILDPTWTAAGIGVTVIDGTVWMTQRFAATAVTTTDVPTVETVLPDPAPVPTSTPEVTEVVDPEPGPEEAQRAAVVEGGPAEGPPPRPASASASPAASRAQSATPPQPSPGQPPVGTVNPGRSGATPAAEHRRGPVAEPGSQGRGQGRP